MQLFSVGLPGPLSGSQERYESSNVHRVRFWY
jgi:hypothetical protein